MPVSPGQADQRSAGVHIPVGGAQAREGGHQIDPAVVFDLSGVIFRVPALREKAKLVPQPLDDRAAHEDAAFQGVLHLAAQSDGDGGQKAVAADAGFRPGIHQQKAAGAVSVFGIAGREAGLPEQGGLPAMGTLAPWISV